MAADQVAADRNHLGFVRSYPNFIPLGAAAVRAIRDRVARYPFNAIYGSFWNAVVAGDGKAQVERFVDQHIAWLERPAD